MHGYASIGWINNDIEFDESAFVSTQGDNNVDNAMEIKSKDANAAEGVKVIAPEKVIANKEEKNPIEFLNNISKWSNILFWEGKLMKITKIDGKIFNSANYTTYNNLTLRASMYDAGNNILGQEEFHVDADIQPGEVLDYKQQLSFWDNNTDKVIVEIKNADPK